MKEINRQRLKSVLIVLLSLAVFLLVLAIYIKIDNYKKSYYKLDVQFENSDIIALNNKLPVSDEIGKAYTGSGVDEGIEGYSSFSITNKNDEKVNYEIYLTAKNKNEKSINSSYIKLYLTDENNNPYEGFGNNKVVSYHDLNSLVDKPGSRLLYKGSLVSGGSKKFILRSWLSDTYILSKIEEDFSYNIEVRIK